MEPDLTKLRRMVAQTCLGNTALRGADAGTAAKAEAFLAAVELFEITAGWSGGWLDHHTKLLQAELPQRRWGHARKAMNLFLRECYYNRWLGPKYFSDAVARQLEVPLDSRVARCLRAARPELPRWQSVTGLVEEVSAVFQRAADEIATERRLLRVHLDLDYWPT